jgi:hypothetical protein
MKPSVKRAHRRYRFKHGPLRMIAKIIRLLENPPKSVEFTDKDKSELMVRFDQMILIWRVQHGFAG